MIRSTWEQRIRRAEELASIHFAAAEILKFYIEIVRLQRTIHDDLKATNQSPADTTPLIPYFPPLLSLVSRTAPDTLAEAAEELSRSQNAFQELLITHWNTGPSNDPADEKYAFFARALLQPYAEFLASRSDISLGGASLVCPFCGEKPVVGVLRGEGDGGKRSLVCSLCSTEWDFRRILCPGCGEEAVDKLPVYTAAGLEHIRVEACDACGMYIKSVDLTRDGLAVPVVDELATIPLNVWAEENGYQKLQRNLLSM